MKHTQLQIFLISATLASTISTFPVYAHSSPVNSSLISHYSRDNITPYYLFVQDARLTFTRNDSETTYRIAINGTSDLEYVSGTVTLYKKNSSGTYERKSSQKHTFIGQSINESDSFNSYGKGSYKIVFSGTAYARNGLTESLDFELEQTYE